MARLNWRMDRLERLLCATVEGLGYQFWGLEFLSGAGVDTLRFYIESSGGATNGGIRSGITADDCSQVGLHISTLLDVEQPVSGNYRLEVSSPGLARRLFRLQQCATVVGHRLDVRLRHGAIAGRRRFRSRLVAVGDAHLSLEVDGETLECPWSQIERVSLVPEYDALLSAG